MWPKLIRLGLLIIIFLAPIGAPDRLLNFHSAQQSFSGQFALTTFEESSQVSSSRRSEYLTAEQPKLQQVESFQPEPTLKVSEQLKQSGQAFFTNSLYKMKLTSQNSEPYYVPGDLVTLKPEASFEVSLDGNIKFTAILSNQSTEGLKLTGELIVVKGDGTTETLLPPRVLRLKAGQRIQIPVELALSSWHFPPGETEFLAILRDLKGEIIDKASVTFRISVTVKQ